MKQTVSMILLLSMIILCGCVRENTKEIVAPPDLESIIENGEEEVSGEAQKLPPVSPHDSVDVPSSKIIYGTASGNRVNYGLTATDDQWIVYVNGTDYTGNSDCKLYRADKEFHNVVKLTDDRAQYVQLVENWVYYSNLTDGEKIYRIKIDGTQREKVSDVFGSGRNFTVADDWVYFIDGALYKMRADGTEITKIIDTTVHYFCIYGNWIYYEKYTHSTPQGGTKMLHYSLARVKTDETHQEKVYDQAMYQFIVEEDRIFYIAEDDQRIYSVDLEGQDVKKITDTRALNFNVFDGWVYYSSLDDEYERLYRIQYDGSNNELLDDSRCYAINIICDWLFVDHAYAAEYSEQFMMRLDGSDIRFVENEYQNAPLEY